MKKGNVNNDKFKVSKLVIIGTFFLFLLLINSVFNDKLKNLIN